ncbi:MAG TPA: serine protease, partial [Fimbriimonas sp.]|nr:serine protease [Fimbriimonas sp.]
DLNKVWKVSSVTYDEANDAAILTLPATSGRTPIGHGDFSKLLPGDDLCIIGHPLGLDDLSLTTGIVSARRKMQGTSVLQTTAAISGGSSGSPVMDRTGKAVAYATSSFSEGQSLNLAASISHIAELYTKPRVPVSQFFEREKAKSKKKNVPKTRSVVTFLDLLGNKLTSLDQRYYVELQKGTQAQSIEDFIERSVAEITAFVSTGIEQKLWENIEVDRELVKLLAEFKEILDSTAKVMKAKIGNLRTGNTEDRNAAWVEVLVAIDEAHEAYAFLRLEFYGADWTDLDVVVDEEIEAVYFNYLANPIPDIVADESKEFNDRPRIGFSWSNSSYVGCDITGLKRSSDSDFQEVTSWFDVAEILKDCRENESVMLQYSGPAKGVAKVTVSPMKEEEISPPRMRPRPVATGTNPANGASVNSTGILVTPPVTVAAPSTNVTPVGKSAAIKAETVAFCEFFNRLTSSISIHEAALVNRITLSLEATTRDAEAIKTLENFLPNFLNQNEYLRKLKKLGLPELDHSELSSILVKLSNTTSAYCKEAANGLATLRGKDSNAADATWRKVSGALSEVRQNVFDLIMYVQKNDIVDSEVLKNNINPACAYNFLYCLLPDLVADYHSDYFHKAQVLASYNPGQDLSECRIVSVRKVGEAESHEVTNWTSLLNVISTWEVSEIEVEYVGLVRSRTRVRFLPLKNYPGIVSRSASRPKGFGGA